MGRPRHRAVGAEAFFAQLVSEEAQGTGQTPCGPQSAPEQTCAPEQTSGPQTATAPGAVTGPADKPMTAPTPTAPTAAPAGPVWVRGHGSNGKRQVLSWMPTSGTNRRLNDLVRLLDVIGRPEVPGIASKTRAASSELLWKELTSGRHAEWLRSGSRPQLGTFRRLDREWLRLRPVPVGRHSRRRPFGPGPGRRGAGDGHGLMPTSTASLVPHLPTFQQVNMA
jgi:hypothetical protein